MEADGILCYCVSWCLGNAESGLVVVAFRVNTGAVVCHQCVSFRPLHINFH